MLKRENFIWLVAIAVSISVATVTLFTVRNDVLRTPVTTQPPDVILMAVAFPVGTEADATGNEPTWVFTDPFANNLNLTAPKTKHLVPAEEILTATPLADVPEGTPCTLQTDGNATVTRLHVGEWGARFGWYPASVTLFADLRQRVTPFESGDVMVLPVFASGRVRIFGTACGVNADVSLVRGWGWVSVEFVEGAVTLRDVDVDAVVIPEVVGLGFVGGDEGE